MSRRTSSALATGAVGAVARSELRRYWRRLLVLGLAAGVLGSAVVGVAVVARRAATAFDRLAAATDMEDASVSVFGDPAVVPEVRALPQVRRSSVSTMFVGAITGHGVAYLSLRSSPPDALGRPVLVEGRLPHPDDPDEVVVTEELAARMQVRFGSSFSYCLLTTQEFASFDTGFGEPDGPCATLRVTGVGRRAGSDQSTNVYAGPAFADRYGAGTVAGRVVDVRLAGGAAAVGAFSDEVAAIAADHPPAAGAEEFPVASVSSPRATRESASATARVLVGGLVVCAVVAAVVGLLLIGQALGRQFEAEAADQQVEAALGLTPLERCLGRVVPSLATAVVAAVVTLAGAGLAATVEPLGPLAALEPHPGWAPNVAVALGGAVLVAVATLALAALAAWRAGRRRAAGGVGARSARRTGRALVGGPVVSTGLSLALGRGRRGGRLPVRATLATVVVGVAGVTAALTFAASLHRLGDQPARWGWNGDVIVVDARAEVVADVTADPRVRSAVWLHQVTGTLDGADATLFSYEPTAGAGTGWTLLRGSAPSGPAEVVMGPKLARRLGAGVGDEVALGLADGTARPLRVVGLGLGPTDASDGFADSALVEPGALDGAAVSGAIDGLLVRAGSGDDAQALVDDLSGRYELTTPAPPTPVQDVLDLDRIPDLLVAYLGVVALAALANGLAVVVRRRSRDLAALRTIGLTPGQTVAAVLTAAAATTGIGLVVGVPLGLAVGRLVWWTVTDRVGLATDVAVPTAGLVLVVAGAVVVALVASALPAVRAGRLRPGELLRAE